MTNSATWTGVLASSIAGVAWVSAGSTEADSSRVDVEVTAGSASCSGAAMGGTETAGIVGFNSEFGFFCTLVNTCRKPKKTFLKRCSENSILKIGKEKGGVRSVRSQIHPSGAVRRREENKRPNLLYTLWGLVIGKMAHSTIWHDFINKKVGVSGMQD
jgi:hypothetical protein